MPLTYDGQLAADVCDDGLLMIRTEQGAREVDQHAAAQRRLVRTVDAQFAQVIGVEGVVAERQAAARQGRGEHPSGEQQPHVDAARGRFGKLPTERRVVGVLRRAAAQVEIGD